MKKIILVSLLTVVFSTNVFSVACSTLTSTNSCSEYYGNSTACPAYYQPTGGENQECYQATSQSSCQNNGGTWKTIANLSSCSCPKVSNATCSYNDGGCYGYGTPCTTS